MVLHATVSAAEWETGLLEPAKLSALAKTFAAEGFACIGNCLPGEKGAAKLLNTWANLTQFSPPPASALDALRERMDFDAAHQAATQKFEERGPNSGAGGHLQMGPPRMAPHITKVTVGGEAIRARWSALYILLLIMYVKYTGSV